MQRRESSREFEFEFEAVKLVRERGVSVSQTARDLDQQDEEDQTMIRGIIGPTNAGIVDLRSARCFSASGFHAWLVWAPSARARSDEEFGARVRVNFISSYRTYGARRVWHDLLAEGLSCGLHRIERLMRVHGLKPRVRRRGLPKDDGLRSVIADNILDRQFTAEAPDQRRIADFTYIWTAEGWLYVADVIDLFSRRVVGWSPSTSLRTGMSDNMAARLVTDALMMAIWQRGKPDALLHHSDQGSQYTSEQFQRLMADNGVTCSTSRSGNVWDNAALESFFSSLKTERGGRKT